MRNIKGMVIRNIFAITFTLMIIILILATGLQLIVGNVLAAAQLDLKSLILTTVLALALIISRRITKKGIQPIALIVISAALGMIVFGI